MGFSTMVYIVELACNLLSARMKIQYTKHHHISLTSTLAYLSMLFILTDSHSDTFIVHRCIMRTKHVGHREQEVKEPLSTSKQINDVNH